MHLWPKKAVNVLLQLNKEPAVICSTKLQLGVWEKRSNRNRGSNGYTGQLPLSTEKDRKSDR